MVEQDRKAGTGAGGDVAGTDEALEQPGDMGERGISGDAAMALVDLLQALDVDADQGRRRAVAVAWLTERPS